MFGTSVAAHPSVGSAQQAQNAALGNIAHGLHSAPGSWTTTTNNTNGLLAAQQQRQAYNNMLAQNSALGSTQSGRITGETHVPATSKDLEHEAYNVSVESLVNLWVTRWGNEWADLSEIEQDEFFRLAYRRLKQMGELETHYLTDRARYVCRRPE